MEQQKRSRMETENEYCYLGNNEVLESDCEGIGSEGSRPDAISQKKKLKADVHKHFETIEIHEFNKVVLKQNYKYCGPRSGMYSKSSGTSTLRKHLQGCGDYKKAHPEVQPSNQGTLLFSDGMLNVLHFSQTRSRIDLCDMVIQDKRSFRSVEAEGFTEFVKNLRPEYKIISPRQIQKDILLFFEQRKQILKRIICQCSSKMSCTTDLWTSNQRLPYMCVTAHWVTAEWKPVTVLLYFNYPTYPHNGDKITAKFLDVVQDWEINKIMSITLDDASSNDGAVPKILAGLQKKRIDFVSGGRLFHWRCLAHICNLIVEAGEALIKKQVSSLRQVVVAIHLSAKREQLYIDVCNRERVDTNSIPLDVKTRWNSTFAMCNSAIKKKSVLKRLSILDKKLTLDLSENDWEVLTEVLKLLKPFLEISMSASGQEYPTINLALPHILKVKSLLRNSSYSKNPEIVQAVTKMKQKFDKYWGEIGDLAIFGAFFDPRMKLSYLEWYWLHIDLEYTVDVNSKIDTILKKVDMIYKETYVPMQNSSSFSELPVENSFNESLLEHDYVNFTEFTKRRRETICEKSAISPEIQSYLQDPLVEYSPEDSNFNVLEWWSNHEKSYPILSFFARDILAVKSTSVPSENTFSCSGRVINDYRTGLLPGTVQALMCQGSWLKASKVLQWGMKMSNFRMVTEESIVVFTPKIQNKV